MHLVVEYCHGGDLHRKLKKIDHFTEQKAKRIIRQCLQALNYLHNHNIAHRDLKPENILIVGDSVKLIDFGISMLLQDSNQLMNSTRGTPFYFAPEVLEGKYDKRCDLWAIGVIAFEMLAGEPPFNGEDFAELQSKIKAADYNFQGNIE